MTKKFIIKIEIPEMSCRAGDRMVPRTHPRQGVLGRDQGDKAKIEKSQNRVRF